jgi:hypothetical protein
MMKKLKYSLYVLLFLFIILVVQGCTPLERTGYSAIPQNSPASWEITTF